MTDDSTAPEVVTKVVHVSPGTEELVESLEHPSTFLPDVPDWDETEQAHPARQDDVTS